MGLYHVCEWIKQVMWITWHIFLINGKNNHIQVGLNSVQAFWDIPDEGRNAILKQTPLSQGSSKMLSKQLMVQIVADCPACY